MGFDEDIKIAPDFLSEKIKPQENNQGEQNEEIVDKAEAEKAIKLGKRIAEIYINDVFGSDDESGNADLIYQRKLLLSFTATAGMEEELSSALLSGIAQKSFLDTVKAYNEELYETSSDMGAFSFYYLAYRRGGDIERRMGQTFAMLCSHDGDPIYQELGEALYCWFSSEIRKTTAEIM